MALKHDIRYALRSQITRPRFVIVALVTLALGIGANAAIFSVVNAVLLRPLPYADPDRLVILQEQDSRLTKPVAYPNFRDWQTMSKTLQDIACFRGATSVLVDQAGAERLTAKLVSQNFLRTLGAEVQIGRDFTPEEDSLRGAQSVIISDALWRSRFNRRADVIGKSVNVDELSRTIVGVAPVRMPFAGEADLYLPIYPIAYQEPRFNHDGLYAVGRIKAGFTPEQAQAEMRVIARQLEMKYPKENAGETVVITPLASWLTGDLGRLSLILLGAVSFVLLIACVNVASLFLARAKERQREFAIRAAIGAEQRQLVRQNLVESLLIALEGGALGLLFVQPVLSSLSGFVAFEQADAFRTDWHVVAYTLLLSCLTAVLFGIFPAFSARRINVSEALKDREPAAARRRHLFRDGLVVAQIGLALVLLVGSGLMIRSILRLIEIDPGFDPKGVVTMQIQGPETRFTTASQTKSGFDVRKYVTLWKNYDREVLARVQAIPGVDSAAMTFPLVMTGGTAQIGIQFEGHTVPSDVAVLHRYSVSPDYFKTMRIPLLRGRGFSMADDFGAPNVAILNQAAARQLSPERDPIGRHFILPDVKEFGAFTIVGIVADTKHDTLHAPVPPQIYLSFLQWPSTIILTIRTRLEAGQIAAAVRRQVQAFDKSAPVYGVRTLEDWVSSSTASNRRIATLLGVFAALALLLASIGIYGTMMQLVAQRRREIGVRIAVGAAPAGVLWLIVRKALLLAALGTILGVAGALALTRVLSQWLVGVSVTDPATFAGVALTLALVTVGATLWPALNAASTDPLAALKCE